ncbi:MAG: hypothetical protein QOJ83_1051 [Frankiales bacterium]|jgi:hypothetical protein|nr:hypothetical protein [Frankiales bacterium]
MGVPTRTQAERAIRRAVNPLSTAVTKFVQSPDRRRGWSARAIGRVTRRREWPPDDDGGAGVREPRRPLPTKPSDVMELDLPR